MLHMQGVPEESVFFFFFFYTTASAMWSGRAQLPQIVCLTQDQATEGDKSINPVALPDVAVI